MKRASQTGPGAGAARLLAFSRRLSRPQMSRYRGQYLASVLEATRWAGPAAERTSRPELDEVFIELDLAERAPHPPASGSDVPGVRRSSLRDRLDQAEPVVLVVFGVPGGGKTTLLAQAARRTAQTFRERRRSVPVLLRLGGLATALRSAPEVTLPELIRRSIPDLPIPEPAGWWDDELARGSCLLLFDGLDEVDGATRRRDVIAWINRQIAAFPGNDVVITSRPYDDHDDRVRSATALQILPVKPDQAHEFLHRWYLALERRAAGSAGREAELNARLAADNLVDQLAPAPTVHDLTTNPLLLTMIANVHRFGHPLPNGRADLYRKFCAVLLQPPQPTALLDLESRERPLAALAFEMMRNGSDDIGRRQLRDGIASLLHRVTAAVTPDQFIADVATSGLLVEREPDRFSFAHRTLREYLAARHVQERGLEHVLVEAVGDPRWRTTTLFYVAGAGADRIVRAALESGSAPALSLAFECSEVDAELAPELRRQLADVLARAFEDDSTSERRRLAAAVLADRHLSRLVLASSGLRLCPDPVPGNLYRLFLRDTGTPPPDGPFSADPSWRHPIQGMWSRDAAAFVRWLNLAVSATGVRTRRAEGVVYRLPTSAELTASAGGLTGPANRVWCLADGGPAPTVWTRPGLARGDLVPIGELSEYARTDLRGSTVVEDLLARTAVRAAQRLSATGDSIRQDSSDLSETLVRGRSGQRAGDLERDMVSALPIISGLRGRLRDAQRAAALLDSALRKLTRLDAAAGQALDRALTDYPIDRAVADLRRVSSMEHDLAVSLDWSRDLDISGAAKAAETVARRVGAAHQRLRKLLEAAPGAPKRPGMVQALALDLPIGAGREVEILRLTMSAVLQSPNPANDPDTVDLFAAALLRLSIPAGSPAIPVDLDRVASLVRRLTPAEPGPDGEPGPPPWVAEVTRRLVAAARPILDRQRSGTPADARAIRVPALLLAGEAEIAGQPRRAAALRELAAAMCLMSRRRADPQLLETLFVAGT